VEAIREYLKSVEDKEHPSLGKRDVSLGIACFCETAKALSQMEPPPRDAFLIGSASNIKPLTRVDQDKISQLLSIPCWKVPEAAFTSKRCFKPDIGFDGTVFACGNNVIVSVSGQETVVQLRGFMSVNNEGAMHSLLGHGVCYPLHLTDNGQVDTHYWSGFV